MRAEFTSYLPDIHCLLFVSEARVPGNDGIDTQCSQGCDQILGQPVREILLVCIATQVSEWQYGDRVPSGEAGYMLIHCTCLFVNRFFSDLTEVFGFHLKNAYRFGNILEGVSTLIPDLDRELSVDLIQDCRGYRHAARVCSGLDSCRDIYAIADDTLSIHDQVADVETDPEQHAAIRGEPGVARRELPLSLDRALDGIHRAGKLRQQIVTHHIHDATAMGSNESGH